MAIKDYYYLYINRIKWKNRNKHNYTFPVNIFDIDNVKVGKYTYGPINVFNDTLNKLIIGNYCSISQNVKFIVGGEHNINTFSTYPFKHYFEAVELEATSKGDIIVDDDVWFGYGSIVLSGVHIGQGSVIAAGSVVTKDVEPYSIVGGNPAKLIKYRFSKDIINELLKVDFSKIDSNIINNHINELYENIIDVDLLNWLPKR